MFVVCGVLLCSGEAHSVNTDWGIVCVVMCDVCVFDFRRWKNVFTLAVILVVLRCLRKTIACTFSLRCASFGEMGRNLLWQIVCRIFQVSVAVMVKIYMQVIPANFFSLLLLFIPATKYRFSRSSTRQPSTILPLLLPSLAPTLGFHLQFSAFLPVSLSCAPSHQLVQQRTLLGIPSYRRYLGNYK